MNLLEEQLIHNLASRLAPGEGLVSNSIREHVIKQAKLLLAERLLPLLEAHRRQKTGWMDSTNFQYELGHALGGVKIYPDEADCKKNCPCVAHPDMTEPCTAQRVMVLDADSWEEAWTKLESLAW